MRKTNGIDDSPKGRIDKLLIGLDCNLDNANWRDHAAIKQLIEQFYVDALKEIEVIKTYELE